MSVSSFSVILVHPLPVNTTVNSGQVNFTCIARAQVLIFYVNDRPADDANIVAKGFNQQDTEPVNNTIRIRVLLVDPREGNNNTNIYCVGFIAIPSSDDISDTVLLLIQGIYHVLYPWQHVFYYLIIGLLEGVRDLIVNVTSTNTVTLSWSAPYTLDNTYINGYNITITNTLTNEIETYFTESLQLSYQSGSNETNPCTEIIVDIFAINTAGNGDVSTVSFYFPKGMFINSNSYWHQYGNVFMKFVASYGHMYIVHDVSSLYITLLLIVSFHCTNVINCYVDNFISFHM